METIVIAIISSGLLSVIITEIFAAVKDRKSKKDGVEAKIDEIVAEQKAIRADLHRQEKDNIRTELKLMISDFPEEESDILRLAQHYFSDLQGNWTMSNIFTEWCRKSGIDLPNWVNK